MNSSSDSESPKDLRSRRREATRQEILQAARIVFSEEGINEAKMENIAARAGVSVGTLYNYFDDRQALLESLFEAMHVALLEAVDNTRKATSSCSFVEQLHAFVACVLSHFDAHRVIMGSVFEIRGDPQKMATGREQMQTRMRSIYDRAAAVCAVGLQSGSLRAQNAGLYPAMLMGLIRGVTVRSYLEPETGPLLSAEDAITELFLHGAASAGNKKRGGA